MEDCKDDNVNTSDETIEEHGDVGDETIEEHGDIGDDMIHYIGTVCCIKYSYDTISGDYYWCSYPKNDTETE